MLKLPPPFQTFNGEILVEQILADIEPAPLGLELSSDEVSPPGRCVSIDQELPYSFSDDLARGGLQGNLATASSADFITNGRTPDFPRFCEQLQDSSHGDAFSRSMEDPGTALRESQRACKSCPEQDAARYADDIHHHSNHPTNLKITPSAIENSPSLGTKAKNGREFHKARVPSQQRTFAPLPTSSPYILKSHSENTKTFEPFPAESPFVLKLQCETGETFASFPADSPLILKSKPEGNTIHVNLRVDTDINTQGSTDCARISLQPENV